jgi:hypothetical protein
MEYQMKNKYHGLAGLIISGLSLICMLSYGVYLADKMTGSIRISRPVSVPDIKVPDQNTMAYIDFLTTHLTNLATLKKRNSNVNLALFGFNPALINEKNIPEIKPTLNIPNPLQEEKNEEKVHFSYDLTLSFISLKNSFCVIDDTLYKKNGVLPDGGKILKIENDRVLILKHKKKQWIYPLQIQKISQNQNQEQKEEQSGKPYEKPTEEQSKGQNKEPK